MWYMCIKCWCKFGVVLQVTARTSVSLRCISALYSYSRALIDLPPFSSVTQVKMLLGNIGKIHLGVRCFWEMQHCMFKQIQYVARFFFCLAPAFDHSKFLPAWIHANKRHEDSGQSAVPQDNAHMLFKLRKVAQSSFFAYIMLICAVQIRFPFSGVTTAPSIIPYENVLVSLAESVTKELTHRATYWTEYFATNLPTNR